MRVMVTLTFPAPGLTERSAAFGYLQRFAHIHPRALHRGKGYVAVGELHVSGKWHLHLLVPGGRWSLKELTYLRLKWTKFLVGQGFVLPQGTRFVRIHLKQWSSSRKAAYYAAKYISKATDKAPRLSGEHRYRVSDLLAVLTTENRCSHWQDAKAMLPAGAVVVRAWDTDQESDWKGPPAMWLEYSRGG